MLLNILNMTLAKNILTSIFITFSLLACSQKASSNKDFFSFDDIYEPSAIIQLSDGRILIAEDEKDYPFSLLSFDSNAKKNQHFKRLPFDVTLKYSDGSKAPLLNDLEGLTQGKQHWIYATTSHSRNSKGKRKAEREQLVRFRIEKNGIVDYQIAIGLTEYLQATLPKKKAFKKLNIEGLAYDQQHGDLLLGLRSPLHKNKATLIRLKNPEALFKIRNTPHSNSSTEVSHETKLLDLDGNSIRSIEYDPILKGYIIVAGSVKDRGKPFKLWLWKENKLQKIKLKGIDSIGYTEGITSVKDSQGNAQLLLVHDDGQRGQSTGHYQLLPYDKITLK